VRKRLRKKLRLSEYTEYGCLVTMSLKKDMDEAARDAFLDHWIESAVEVNNLSCGGGGSNERWSFFVALCGRGSVTEEHRAKLSEWLSGQREIESFTVGPLEDAWHGWKG